MKYSKRPAIAVPAEHQAAPVVVAVQLVPEWETVANQHGVVPGHRDQGAGQQGEREGGQKLRAGQAPPVPGEEQIGQKHDDRQAQPGQTLGQDGQAAQDGGQVKVEGCLVAGLRRIPHEDAETRSGRATWPPRPGFGDCAWARCSRVVAGWNRPRSAAARSTPAARRSDRKTGGAARRTIASVRRGSSWSSSSNKASAHRARARVMGPMKAMSVMACRATRLNMGKVASASTDSRPARRLTKRETARYTPTSASSAMRQKGRRSAHSGLLERAKVPAAGCRRARRPT